MHQNEIEEYYPTRNNEYRELKELIEEDPKLKYIYDNECFKIKIDNIIYNLSSQILNRVRNIVYISYNSKIIIYIKNNILNELCDYPNNNSLYMMLLSGNNIIYGDEQREKQAHIMTHQIYKGVLEKNKSDMEEYFMLDITNILKEYYKYLSMEKPNNLFFTTQALRDYHYSKQKNNAYYHIDSINLPFQNIEFYLLGGDKND